MLILSKLSIMILYLLFRHAELKHKHEKEIAKKDFIVENLTKALKNRWLHSMYLYAVSCLLCLSHTKLMHNAYAYMMSHTTRKIKDQKLMSSVWAAWCEATQEKRLGESCQVRELLAKQCTLCAYLHLLYRYYVCECVTLIWWQSKVEEECVTGERIRVHVKEQEVILLSGIQLWANIHRSA